MTRGDLTEGILYVIPTYPPVGSQPFVVNEMVEVQRSGRPLAILGLRPNPRETLRHATFAALEPRRVLPASLVDPATLGLALVAAVRWPGRVLRTLGGLHRAAGANPWAHLRLLAVTQPELDDDTIPVHRRFGANRPHRVQINEDPLCVVERTELHQTGALVNLRNAHRRIWTLLHRWQ